MAKDPYRFFRIEARELLDALQAATLELERGEPASRVAPAILRTTHTLKGAARVVRLPELANAAHRLEDVLQPHVGVETLPKPVLRGVLDLVARLEEHLAAIDGAGSTSSPLAPEPVSPSPAQQVPAGVPPPAMEPNPQEASKAATAPIAPPSPAPSRSIPKVTPVRPARPRPNGSARAAALAEGPETIRVELQRLDALLGAILETGTRLDAMRRILASVAEAEDAARQLARELSRANRRERGLAEVLAADLDRLGQTLGTVTGWIDRDLRQSRDLAVSLRLVRVGDILGPLERAARDAAEALGRDVRFESSGGDVSIDPHVLKSARDALGHIVRNAVAHGIEAPEARVAAGKPAAGVVRVDVERRGRQVLFRCQDDGCGIDLARVREAGIARGELADDADDAAVIEALLHGGISTASSVSEVAGRGVGMDAVRELVVRCKGDLRVSTVTGGGTTFEVWMPVSAASLATMAVRVAGRVVHIPLEGVLRSARYAVSDIARTGDSDSVLFDGRAIPLVDLSALLGQAVPQQAVRSALVVGAGGRVAAVSVDRILGPTEVVSRPLPTCADVSSLIAGVTLDANGDVDLVLDRTALVEAAHGDVRAVRRDAETARLPILVCDDSLTTRMLEQSILELAGYEVDLAISGEQALELARSRRYALYVCDVEMPGMNGFEFVSRTRADPSLRDTPAILVTSLARPEDRRKGEEAGARAYIVKGEFDQGVFLNTIRELVG